MPITGFVSHNLAVAIAGAGPFVGAGDIISTWVAWWGLRAIAFSKIGTMNVIRLRRDGDNAESDFNTVAGGGLDLASINTFFTGGTPTSTNLFTTKLYDQTGNGNDIVQAVVGQQPPFFFNAIGTRPMISFVSRELASGGAPTPSIVQPLSASAVALNVSSGSNAVIIDGGTPQQCAIGVDAVTVGDWYAFAGSTFETPASASTWHAVQVLYNGTSSKIQIDGAAPVTGNAGTNGVASELYHMGAITGTVLLNGNIMEAGFASGDQSANWNALNANQHSYYGF